MNVSRSKRYFFLLSFVVLVLVGFIAFNERDVPTTLSGVIKEVTRKDGKIHTILIQNYDENNNYEAWISLPPNLKSNIKIGDKGSVTVDSAIAESYPLQAKAKTIKIER